MSFLYNYTLLMHILEKYLKKTIRFLFDTGFLNMFAGERRRFMSFVFTYFYFFRGSTV